MSDNDPFDCFGSDEDDSEHGDEYAEIKRRDTSCGVMSFHAGTEQAMLHHVQSKTEHDVGHKATSVLEACDEFCMTRHWMMHVGNQKSGIIKEFLMERCQSWSDKRNEMVFVELGTYCGYSSLLIAKIMQELEYPCHIFTVEAVLDHIRVAEKLIRLGGMEDRITILHFDPEGSTPVSKVIHGAMIKRYGDRSDRSNRSSVDFLFIDHDKPLYLEDLQQLEKASMIKKGCHVAADNVVFAQIDDYREYMADLAARGAVRTELKMSELEYSKPDQPNGGTQDVFEDGIEVSVYIQDACL